MNTSKSVAEISSSPPNRQTSGLAPAPVARVGGVERRQSVRDFRTPPVPQPPARLDDYQNIIGQASLDALRFLARGLKGKTIKMVNSTAMGGGVAEMLNCLVPMLTELEVTTHWDVITGGNDFFEVTKAFHNALQGNDYQLTKHVQEIFLMYNEQNMRRMQFGEDLVVIHDPQPAALVRNRKDSTSHWVWRCHIDLSHPNPQVWDFLRPYVEQYDGPSFLLSLLPASFRFRNTFFILASIRYPRKTNISRTHWCGQSATSSESIGRARLCSRSRASTGLRIR